jgi:hypothetical protein
MSGRIEPVPLPEHPVLAIWAKVLNDTGNWANIYDAQWPYVYETDEQRATYGSMGIATAPIGAHIMSTEARRAFERVLGVRRPDPDGRPQ